jgi:hypothetical protein
VAGQTQTAAARLALGLVALAVPACYRDASSLAPSGKGLPQVVVDFPATSNPGSVHTARLEVTNPGPGDIGRLAVSFALVGAPAAQGLPTPVVAAARRGRRTSVLAVSPRPTSVGSNGVVYRFAALPEGEVATIAFRLRVPRAEGQAANSVTVYDELDPSRARGVRLETTVKR